MDAARKAGWFCLFGGLAFVPFAAMFRWMAVYMAGLPVLSTFCMVCFWLVVALIVISLLYAGWGLACGYSQAAWDAYARQVQDETVRGAMEFCRLQGIEPPSFLKGANDVQ